MKVASAIVFGTGFTFTLGSLCFAADQQLPIPCVAGSCGSGVSWVSSGQASSVATGSRLDITQTSNKATLNWQSFNVGEGNTVKFIQPGSDAVALNRIFQADPSRIQGSIQANGQIYLVNRNGIIFDRGAQVNAHSFTASSLDIADDVLEKGVFAPARDGRAAFALTPKVDADGKPVPGGDVRVEAGASIKTDQAGRIMLLAPNVENKGTLQAPDGQVILAAGEKAWISDSSDPDLRGYLVEVDTGGKARNAGELLVDRGNISLIGLAVNQDGHASAKTAVSLAGSVRLVARDTVRVQNGNIVTDRAGSVELGESSVTEVVPDLTDTAKAVDDQAQPKARIEMMGKTIEVGKDARLVATSGAIDFVATTSPANSLSGQTAGNGTRIDIAPGAILDVSGTKDVVLPMERNVLTVELRGNELRDSPEQRDGVLYGKKIQVDIRKGTPVADISGALATIQRGVGERTTSGGTIRLRSEDAVNVGAGSKLDVSGGSVRYESGLIETTRLLSQGQVIDISQADPDQHYDAVLSKAEVTSQRWGVTTTYDMPGAHSLATREAGYIEGKDAGAITLLGTQMQMDGTLLGSTVKGRYQRDLPSAQDLAWKRPTSQLALGGQLIFGDPTGLSAQPGQANFRLPSVLLQSPQESGLVPMLEVAPDTLALDPGMFARGGFTRVGIYSNGRIELPEDEQLTLAPGGELTLVSGSVETSTPDPMPSTAQVDQAPVPPSLQIDGDILIPSGQITLRTVQTTLIGSGGLAGVDSHNTLEIGSAARLDVSGQWVNDTVGVATSLPEDIIATRGGSISLLSAGGVNVSDGASFLLNGGAWLDRTGKLNAGRGGDLSIASTLAAPPTLHFGGTAESFGLFQGGTLSLSAGGVWISDASRNTVSDSVLSLNPGFFQEGGFSGYNLTATHFGLTVDEDTVMEPRAKSWVLSPSSYSAPTGTSLSSLVRTESLADFERKPVSVSLTSKRGEEGSILDAGLTISRGAAIIADPGATISLTSDLRIDVEGELRAQAGQINLSLAGRSLSDGEFTPERAIRLGSDAVLAATGYVRHVPNGLGLLQGEVLDAGTVSLRADRGSLITDPGSLIDVSGTSGFLDLLQPGTAPNPYARTEVAGAAGSILMEAPDAMLLTGAMRANAAAVAGASGGDLVISLSSYIVPPSADQKGPLKDPTGIRDVVFRTDSPDTLFFESLHGESLFSAQDLRALQSADNKVESRATVSLARVQSAGFDEISVKVRPALRDSRALADTRIVFDDGSVLQARRSITLDAPILWGGGGNALVEAPYVALGPTDTLLRYNPAPVSGAGTLKVRADLIDLVGDLAVQGFGDASHAALDLESRGDIRLNGLRVPEQDSVDSTGSLEVEGTLHMSAAQIYPTTLTQFSLQAVGPRSLVSITGGDASAAKPLSAAGLLSIAADRIDVAGVLRAPHGQIVLDAADRLTLMSGSEVSVAGSTLPVPFGTTQFGRDWLLPYEPTLARVIEGDEDAAWSTGLPEKHVELTGENVDLQSGANVVLDGGGDLYASEFIPGPGGSKDILLPENADGAIAIVPTLNAATAPIDPFMSYEGIKVGDTIQIGAGTPDLPAGTYAVLPARYALLPGAVLLTPTGMTGLASTRTGGTLRGLPIVAGRRGDAMAGTFDSLWSGYVVENGAQVRERAEYRESLANKFFADRAESVQIPADAGRLVINAGAGLSLAGTVSAGGPGRGGQVDIAADDLSVVSSLSADSSSVELLASQLSRLRVDSLLLGGQREQTADGVRIEASANRVSIESGVDLQLPELILAARSDGATSGSQNTTSPEDTAPEPIDGLHVATGATLRGVGDAAAAPSRFLVDGDTAFLRVSSGDAAEVERTSAPSATGSAQIALDAGSALFAGAPDGQLLKGGSITIDSGGNAVSSAALTLGTGGALQLAASRITLGGDSSTTADEGLALSQDVLSQLNASNLSLKSRSSIDILGNLDFGVSGTLTLDTPLLQGVAADDGALSALLHADTLRWKSTSTPAAVNAAADPTGQLTLSASTLLLGDSPDPESGAVAAPSNLMVGGFAATRLEGTTELVMNSTGSLKLPGELQIAAPWVTTADGANWSVTANGALTVSATTAGAPMPANVGLGSSLSLTGTSVLLAGGLLLPAGSVSLTATGDGDAGGSVHLASNALINAAAVREYFLDQAVETPGGRVALSAAHGDVLIDAGAKIDVSGQGGSFLVQAQGMAQLDGSFVASSGGLQEGSFSLSAGRISDFSALNSILNAGGFDASRYIRLGSGDAVIGAGETVRARDLSIALDNGSFYLGGVIDASGDSAGHVQISARNDVTLANGSRIDASAHGEDRLGGEVMLGSTTGVVAVSSGATIDVRGTRKVLQDRQVLDADGQPIQRTDASGAPIFDSLGQPVYVLEQVALTDTGHVRYRMPASILYGPSSRASKLAGTVLGAGAIDIEGFKTYTDSLIDGNDVAPGSGMFNDAASFMSHESTILASLGASGDERYHLLPGIEIVSTGDMSLSASWNLADWRFGANAEPGVLTLRAGGDLLLQQSLSDGVDHIFDPIFFTEKDVLRGDRSWTYNLVAGADLSSAGTLATNSGSGDVVVDSGTAVRTGTGDITIRAGRDLVLQDQSSVIYTAGRDAGPGTLDPLILGSYINGVFPQLGGSVDIEAQRDISAPEATQLVNDWFWRIGGIDPAVGNVPRAVNVSLTDFRQGVAAFGGGNVKVSAGGDITNLSVSVPTTSRQVGDVRFDFSSGSVVNSDEVVRDGGDSLVVRAGGDITGGVFFIDRGAGELSAGGSITRQTDQDLYAMLAVGSGNWRVTAARDAAIETVFDPTQSPQAVQQGAAPVLFSAFDSYSDKSALHLLAVAGEARLNQNFDGIKTHPALGNRFIDPAQLARFVFYPGNLQAASLRNNLVIGSSMSLVAAPEGRLNLFADDSVLAGSGGASVTMFDAVEAPPIHLDDFDPARVVARSGDIGSEEILGFDLPKAARLDAGGDILNVRLNSQNLHAQDVTSIVAGGDIRHESVRTDRGALSGTAQTYFRVGGPGRVDLLAGGDIDLGTAGGILTTGNLNNPFLPSGGASVTAVAGLREPPRFDAFIEKYLVNSTDYASTLTKYLSAYDTDPSLSDIENFRALPIEQQRPFLWQTFFDELRTSGVDATKSGSNDFSRGYAAIDVLFPESVYSQERSHSDLSLLLSQISTLDGGDINLIVPGGAANAGVATTSQLIKTASQLGVVVQRAGNVNAFTRGDFLVNQSRVFTLDGGSILMWSSKGNIDAGRGAKTALAAPPPLVTTDANGNTVIQFPPAIAGSGIRSIVTTPGVKPGDVYLFAPSGVVNAGDAGIGSAGNVIIGAVQVIGADNIDVGGVAIGIPVDTGGLAASLSSVSAVASGASEASLASSAPSAAEEKAPLAESALGWLDVFVEGFGEETCKPNDAACLERQKKQ